MNYTTRFVTEQVHVALLADSFDDPQPLTNPEVDSPDSIDDMHSRITYNKGACIIRMTDNLLTAENHKLALRKYLKEKAYQTASPIDLFETIQASALETGAIAQYGANFSMIDYFKTWTEQGGHPILNVDVDRKIGTVKIRQRQFNINRGYTTPKMNWVIPITYTTATDIDFLDTKPSHIIKDENTTLNVAVRNGEWIIFNKRQSGFYRVNYDDHSWDLIVKALRGPGRLVIQQLNRAMIVNDVFDFARAGIMSYNRALNIISFLIYERAWTPWEAAIKGFGWIINRLTGSTLEKPMKALFVNWASNVMTNITYLPQDGEPFLRSHLRVLLPRIMCRFGSEECISTARNLFADLFKWGTEVPADIRVWVYCEALREGNPRYFNFLYNRFLSHPVSTEREHIVNLLGCTTDEASLVRFLDLIFKKNFTVHEQDLTDAYSSAIEDNDANAQIVFRYIQKNLQVVADKFNGLWYPLSEIGVRLRSENEVKQFQDWVNQNKDALGDDYEYVLDSANTSIQTMRWAASVHDDINSYLTEGNKPIEEPSVSMA
ncbi:hypothetical protein ACJJTC_018149 [Scirpophaga incertulas]